MKGRESGDVGNCGDVALYFSLCAFFLRATENWGVGNYESLPNPLHRRMQLRRLGGKEMGPVNLFGSHQDAVHWVGKQERGSNPSSVWL